MITKWLKDSGLVVNESKTELCLFHRNDKPKITVSIGGCLVTSKNQINVLGVTFDSKLNWTTHVNNCIVKAKKALYGLRLLRRYFNATQMRMLLDSKFYSILYYNAVVWLTPDLKSESKHDLLSVSALALRSCLYLAHCNEISFINIHKLHKKCTPEQITNYQLSLNLYKTINESIDPMSTETVRVFNQIVCTSRQIFFESFRTNRFKIGMNATENKLQHISKQILLEKLNFNFVHYKGHMKIQFLKFGKT